MLKDPKEVLNMFILRSQLAWLILVYVSIVDITSGLCILISPVDQRTVIYSMRKSVSREG